MIRNRPKAPFVRIELSQQERDDVANEDYGKNDSADRLNGGLKHVFGGASVKGGEA